MAQDTQRKHSVTADGHGERQGLHQGQSLQHIVPRRKIRDVLKRACFMIEHKVPNIINKGFHWGLAYFGNHLR